MITKRASIIAVIGGLLVFTHAASSQRSSLVVTVDQTPGCKDPSVYRKLVAEKDKTAYNHALGAAILAGECTILRRGEAVFATGYSPETHLIKVRRKDFPAEVWTAPNLLEPP